MCIRDRENSYDFVTCTEVVEHFYNPRKELQVIDGLLKVGGVLIVMTDHRREDREFSQWSYRTDSTHVGFFNRKSWQWVSQEMGWEILEYQPRLVVFRKSAPVRRRKAPLQNFAHL